MTEHNDPAPRLRAFIRNFGWLGYPIGLGIVLAIAAGIKSIV